MTDREAASLLLRELAKKVRELSEEEWTAISRGAFRVRIELTGKPTRRIVPPSPNFNAEGVAATLRDLDTIDAGMSLLARECPTRDDLVRLARYIDVPAEKRDTIERLRERIVDGTIGYRLRSEAIRGTKP